MCYFAGCKTKVEIKQDGQNVITCECDHMTSFAVLMVSKYNHMTSFAVLMVSKCDHMTSFAGWYLYPHITGACSKPATAMLGVKNEEIFQQISYK